MSLAHAMDFVRTFFGMDKFFVFEFESFDFFTITKYDNPKRLSLRVLSLTQEVLIELQMIVNVSILDRMYGITSIINSSLCNDQLH